MMLGSAPLMAMICVRDKDKGRNFYEKVLGLPVASEDPYAVVFIAGGTMLRMTPLGDQFAASEHPVLGWSVADIHSAVAKLREAGVQMERYEFLPLDADAVWAGDDGTKVAWFKDPDGNVLSLAQFAQ